MGELQKVVALGLAVAGAGALAVVWLPRLLGSAAGPDVELITLLKAAEQDGLELAVAGRTLESKKVHFQRLTVTVDASGRRATVLGTLDFTGALGATQVSSLGVERVAFVNDGAQWKPETTLAPRLQAAVAALEARRVALEAGNRAALERLAPGLDAGLGEEAEQWLSLVDRKLKVDAWYLRLEREQAQVREEYRLDGFGRDRPFRSAGPRRLSLEQAAGGEFFFPNGLM